MSSSNMGYKPVPPHSLSAFPSDISSSLSTQEILHMSQYIIANMLDIDVCTSLLLWVSSTCDSFVYQLTVTLILACHPSFCNVVEFVMASGSIHPPRNST